MGIDSPGTGNDNRTVDNCEETYEGPRASDAIPLFPRVPSLRPASNKVIYLDSRPPVKSSPSNIEELRTHGHGTLRPPPAPPAGETLDGYETEFLGVLQIILVNLRNMQILHDKIKSDPLFDDFNFAFYLSWRNDNFGNRFSRSQVELYEQFYAVKKDWVVQIQKVGELYNTWHNKLSALISRLKKSEDPAKLLVKATQRMHNLRDENYGKIGWQISAENVEHFEKFVEANLDRDSRS